MTVNHVLNILYLPGDAPSLAVKVPSVPSGRLDLHQNYIYIYIYCIQKLIMH